jgi:hypothetical protein
MPRSKNPERSEEYLQKRAERKARQAEQAVESKVAMAAYRQSTEDALSRMARLRAERLKRNDEQAGN